MNRDSQLLAVVAGSILAAKNVGRADGQCMAIPANSSRWHWPGGWLHALSMVVGDQARAKNARKNSINSNWAAAASGPRGKVKV
mgnify:CR=1 FL=1